MGNMDPNENNMPFQFSSSIGNSQSKWSHLLSQHFVSFAGYIATAAVILFVFITCLHFNLYRNALKNTIKRKHRKWLLWFMLDTQTQTCI